MSTFIQGFKSFKFPKWYSIVSIILAVITLGSAAGYQYAQIVWLSVPFALSVISWTAVNLIVASLLFAHVSRGYRIARKGGLK